MHYLPVPLLWLTSIDKYLHKIIVRLEKPQLPTAAGYIRQNHTEYGRATNGWFRRLLFRPFLYRCLLKHRRCWSWYHSMQTAAYM